VNGAGLQLVEPVLDALRARREELNALDAVAGDGDLGVTVGLAADAIGDAVAALAPDAPVDEALRAIGRSIAQRAPSTAGTLIAFAFLAAAKVGPPSGDDAAGPARALPYLDAAARSIAERGKVAVGDRTMLDALDAAVRAWRAASDGGDDLATVLRTAADAAARAAEATAAMDPTVGRAAWLRDRAIGHPDAGASLVAMAFEAASTAAAEIDPA
jgi:dihydroxyacetone kinase